MKMNSLGSVTSAAFCAIVIAILFLGAAGTCRAQTLAVPRSAAYIHQDSARPILGSCRSLDLPTPTHLWTIRSTNYVYGLRRTSPIDGRPS